MNMALHLLTPSHFTYFHHCLLVASWSDVSSSHRFLGILNVTWDTSSCSPPFLGPAARLAHSLANCCGFELGSGSSSSCSRRYYSKASVFPGSAGTKSVFAVMHL